MLPLARSTSRRTLLGAGGALMAAAALSGAGRATPAFASDERVGQSDDAPTHFRTIDVDGLDIFYREAGLRDAPVVLLLHGFPTSSRMFRHLIPMLSDRYRVIAPDYPAFGHSAVPSRESFAYTHQHIAEVVDGFLTRLGVGRFAMYVMDFGGPIGYRLMLKYPDRFQGVVIQNAPIFGEPSDGPIWSTLLAYWKTGSAESRRAVRASLAPEAVRDQYLVGTRDPSLIDPDDWTIDSALLARPGVDEIMLDLLYDIRNNRETLAEARRFLATRQRQVMIATGVNDPLFPGAIMRPPADMPDIAFHPVDSGHFVLEDRCVEIGGYTRDFLARVVAASR